MFELVKQSKTRLFMAQDGWTGQNFDIESYKTNRDIAVMQNDAATAQYRTQQNTAVKALAELRKASSEVLELTMSKE